MTQDAPQRQHDLRDIFDTMRCLVRSGSPWRYMAGDFPHWEAVYQQTQRWMRAGCFLSIVDDLRNILRKSAGRNAEPNGVIIDSRTIQSTRESGPRAGYDGNKKKKGSKVHMAVDTLGNLLEILVTLADEQERARVKEMAKRI